jgi:hypothetical protein
VEENPKVHVTCDDTWDLIIRILTEDGKPFHVEDDTPNGLALDAAELLDMLEIKSFKKNDNTSSRNYGMVIDGSFDAECLRSSAKVQRDGSLMVTIPHFREVGDYELRVVYSESRKNVLKECTSKSKKIEKVTSGFASLLC